MSDDLDALLAQAAEYLSAGEVPIDDDAVATALIADFDTAVRTLRADYDTALTVIGRLLDGHVVALHEPSEPPTRWYDGKRPTGSSYDPMSDAERAVLAAAETHQERTQ